MTAMKRFLCFFTALFTLIFYAHAQSEDVNLICSGERINLSLNQKASELMFTGNGDGFSIKGLLLKPDSDTFSFEGWFDPLPSVAKESAVIVTVSRVTGAFNVRFIIKYHNGQIRNEYGSGTCRKSTGQRVF